MPVTTNDRKVPCHYPNPDDLGRDRTEEPPEEYGEWADPSGECRHDHCILGFNIGASYRAFARSAYTRDELEEIAADVELVRDEYHGRDPRLYHELTGGPVSDAELRYAFGDK